MTGAGLPPSGETLMYTSAERGPLLAGEKVTETTQLAPSSRIDPQVFVSEKSRKLRPPTPIEVMPAAVPASFVTVNFCGLLFVPTSWLPKPKVAGATFRVVPRPESSTTCGFDDAPSTIITRPT